MGDKLFEFIFGWAWLWIPCAIGLFFLGVGELFEYIARLQ